MNTKKTDQTEIKPHPCIQGAVNRDGTVQQGQGAQNRIASSNRVWRITDIVGSILPYLFGRRTEYYNGATKIANLRDCLLYTSPSPRDRTRSRMPSSA